jgi:hypothetical protein
MANAVPALNGLTLSRISDLGVQLAEETVETAVETL